METPVYFQQFPQLNYLTSINNAGVGQFTSTANLFRRTRLKDSVFKYAAFYYNYNIQEGELPEDVARKIYGDPGLYWIVLQINDIIDVYNQWPLTSYDLDQHILNVYGSWSNAEQISHYETVETKNAVGDIVLPAGIIVSSDYVFRYFPDPNNKIVNEDGDYVQLSSFPISVTYSEVERRKNEDKKIINLLDRKYINEYIRLTRFEMDSIEDKTSDVDLTKFLQ